MIDALFYWTGLLAWAAVALLMASMALVPLAQTTSYYGMCVVAVFKNRRHKLVSWRRLPTEFLSTWWDWFKNGAPTTISSRWCRWEGTFKWHIQPRCAAPADQQGEK